MLTKDAGLRAALNALGEICPLALTDAEQTAVAKAIDAVIAAKDARPATDWEIVL